MPTAHWSDADLPNLQGRTVIVTGANSGIGRAAAFALARAGASVTLAVRDTAKGDAAAATMSGHVFVRPLDLADLGSVRSFAEATEEPFDVLIDNAGVMAVPEQRTVDGFEMQIGTNHLGHFALTNLLLPLIIDRIVVVSSELHRRGRIDLDDLNWEQRSYKAWDAYAASKLANLLFVLELERRLRDAGSPVKAVAVHPGYAATNLQSHTGRAALSFVTAVGNRLIAQRDTMGALPTLYGATAEIPGGSYIGPDGFRHMRGYPSLGVPSTRALDVSMAARLWDLSERLTGVSWPPGPATSQA
jgi:NAD(P)-dependent dehydrogenase (short-subunit alcohol dehydrogenase family)